MSEVTGRLENWFPFGYAIAGTIHGDVHGRFADGKTIRTSTIEGDVSKLKEGDIVKTRNSSYLLGKKAKM